MALNFPPVDSGDGNPTDGQIWTAPSGKQWIYRSSIPGWQSVAATGNSNIVYRGGIDLTVNPNNQYNDIESGNEFIVTKGANPVSGVRYPGLDGEDVQDGSVVRYDGNEWQAISNIPYATTTEPGIVTLAKKANVETDVPNETRVLTPKVGKWQIEYEVPQATTLDKGRTRYATKTEANVGAETEAALTPASIKDLIDQILANQSNSVPTGMISWYPVGDVSFIPPGYLFCDGQRIYDEGVFSDLYQLLASTGNPWGNGPASDVVRIPDLRGVFIRGHDSRAFSNGGRNPDNTPFGDYQGDRWQVHTHEVNDPGHLHLLKGNGYSSSNSSQNSDVLIDDNLGASRVNQTEQATTGISIQGAGGNETRPKNVNLTPIIKL